jgi:hypothetical protein
MFRKYYFKAYTDKKDHRKGNRSVYVNFRFFMHKAKYSYNVKTASIYGKVHRTYLRGSF